MLRDRREQTGLWDICNFLTYSGNMPFGGVPEAIPNCQQQIVGCILCFGFFPAGC